MTARKLSGVVTVCVVLGFLGLSAGASARSCRPHGASAVTSNSVAQVYRIRGRTFGCVRSGGPRRALGDYPLSASETTLRVSNVRLSGRQVAYSFDTSRDKAESEVRVKNLGTGKLLHDATAVASMAGLGDFNGKPAGVTALEFGSGSDVAWIARNVYVAPVRLEVFALHGHSRRLLAADPSIDPTSLRVVDHRILWTVAGTTQSAPFR